MLYEFESILSSSIHFRGLQDDIFFHTLAWCAKFYCHHFFPYCPSRGAQSGNCRWDKIKAIQLRLADHKRKSVQYLQKLNFEVIASGDSYNDIGMLKTADYCTLFNPPSSLVSEYPDMAQYEGEWLKGSQIRQGQGI